MIAKLAHCRMLSYCRHGIETVCERHDIDFKRLVLEGIPVSELEDIDDAFIQKLIITVKETT